MVNTQTSPFDYKAKVLRFVLLCIDLSLKILYSMMISCITLFYTCDIHVHVFDVS